MFSESRNIMYLYLIEIAGTLFSVSAYKRDRRAVVKEGERSLYTLSFQIEF